MDGHARAAVADGRAPEGMDQAAVVKEIEANLIRDAVLIPAMVGEVSRAQQIYGFGLVFVPAFRP